MRTSHNLVRCATYVLTTSTLHQGKHMRSLRFRPTHLGPGLFLYLILAGSILPSVVQAVQEFSSPAPVAGGNFGISVAGAGDLNGNGADDFIVGAPVENGDGPLGGLAGRIYVYDGGTGALIWNLFPPPFLGQRYGTTVAGGSDINGDGINDIIAGSLSDKALAFSGATGDTLFLMEHPTGLFSTSFGVEVGDAGDFNNDGSSDVIVGAYNEDVGGFLRAGRAYVFGGPNGGLIATLESPLLEDGQFGIDVAGAGDVNNDGWDDVIIGAYLDRVNGLSDSGRAYVFSGATEDTLFSLQAPVPLQSAHFGKAVDGLGDITGDGRADVIVGALQDFVWPSFSKGGKAYVFSGADGSLVYELQSPTPDTNGFFGSQVAGVGDYDGDGINDMVVCAHTEDEGGINGSGRAHVFSGATGLLLDTFVSPNLENFGRFGIGGAAGGDINNDGRSDIMIGAGLEVSAGLNDAGRAYLFTAPLATPAPPLRSAFNLGQNVPNPFNPNTVIHFELSRPAMAQLTVFDARGRRVEVLLDKWLESGSHVVHWDAAQNASGTYFYELSVGGQVATQKMVLLK